MADNAKNTERVFLLFLFLSPLLDLVNGIGAYLAAGGTGGMLSTLDLPAQSGAGPSMIVRLLFLALMLFYLLRNREFRALRCIPFIAACWAATALTEHFTAPAVSWTEEVQYMARFGYSLLVLLSYGALLRERRGDAALQKRINAILCASQGLLALGVVLPFLFGMGFYTYADPLGYRGCRGFFYAGNDVTAALLLLTPLTLCELLERFREMGALRSALFVLSNAASFAAMLLVGTKTSFVAAAVIALACLVFCVCRALGKRRDAKPLLRLLLVLAAVLALLALLYLVGRADPFAAIRGSIGGVEQYVEVVDMENGLGVETVLFSGRTATLREAFAQFRARLPLSALFGIGRGSQSHIIEMDVFEVLFYYGVLGAAAMLWPYLRRGLPLIPALLRRWSLSALAGLLSLGLAAAYLVLAGHVLFSVTSGFFFAFVIVYASSFLCEGERGETAP